MKYQIVGRSVKVTEAMEKQVLAKLSKLEKYFDKDADIKCVITFSVSHRDQAVEVAISARNIDLRAKVVSSDAYEAIDLVVDKLEGQIRKMKTQLAKIHKKAGLSENIRMDMVDDEDEEDIYSIVKRKRLSLVLMEVEEAEARMDALDHSFFIYLDSDSGLVSVLYRRQDGDYGLIEIEE